MKKIVFFLLCSISLLITSCSEEGTVNYMTAPVVIIANKTVGDCACITLRDGNGNLTCLDCHGAFAHSLSTFPAGTRIR